jgi:ribosomal protein S18 acetylase RimI-like enzyme
MTLQTAAAGDAAAIAALRTAAADELTSRFGAGHWSSAATEPGVLSAMRHSKVYVARRRRRVIATLTIATRKPWAIDRSYFTAVKRPVYLVNMAVDPRLQRQGIGRRCVGEAVAICGALAADAICLDAYDTEAGAGDFYRKCGFREVGRATYRGTPLVYFEKLIRP